MFIGNIHTGAYGRPGGVQSVSFAAAAPAADSVEESGGVSFHRTISSITPSSFAGAYQALRGVDGGAMGPSNVAASENATILNGSIPAAIQAYGEILEDAD
jgi:hypothetical protein